MGSFNVGCGISNLSIDQGEKVGFILLQNNPENEYRRNGNDVLTNYIYNTDLYKPMLPLVFGEYGDYGRIENIEETATTRIIEKMFGRPAQTVLDCVTSNRKTYDKYGATLPAYGSVAIQELGYNTETDAFMEAYGFTKESTDEDTDVYTFDNYTFKNVKGLKWEITQGVQNEKKRILEDKYFHSIDDMLDSFSSATGVYPGFERNDWNALNLLCRLSGMFVLESVYKEMSAFHSKENADREASINAYYEESGQKRPARGNRHMEAEKAWPEFVAAVRADNENEDKSGFNHDLFRLGRIIDESIEVYSSFPFEDIQLLTEYSDFKEFAEIKVLVDLMMSVNRMIMPSFNGEQHGNSRASLKLQNFTNGILKERILDTGFEEEELALLA